MVLVADGKVPDPADPRIAQYTTGKSRQHIEGLFVTRKQYSQRTYGKPVLHIKVVRVEGSLATVVDCVDSSNFGWMEKDGTRRTVGTRGAPITT
ncbi:MAG: hypothetical protein ABIM89_05670, partial [Mycobacteriales bacterium]